MADFTGGQKSKSKKMKMELTIPKALKKKTKNLQEVNEIKIEEQERIAREEQERIASEEQERIASEEQERIAREEQERIAGEIQLREAIKIKIQQESKKELKSNNIEDMKNDDKKNINYEIKQANNSSKFINNKLWAHLHCYDIDKFDEIYGEYIENIMKYFSVLITYSKGNNIPNFPLTFIHQIKNAEINEKNCVIEYLENMDIYYDNILFIQNIKYLHKFDLDKLLLKIIESKDKFIALDIFVESKENNISDDKVTNYFINKDTIQLLNLNINESFINSLIYNQIKIFIIDENLNLHYKYINYNKKYSLLKGIEESDYEIIEHKFNHDLYENVIILCSHYKKYTDYVFKNIFNNLINYILHDSKSLLIIVYSSDEKENLINNYKKHITSDDYIIVKDIKNDKVDFGKFCLGYKAVKYFNIDSEKYHLINDSFICSSSCESMYVKWRDNYRHADFVGGLRTKQLLEHFQSWWLIMNGFCLEIYMNELLSYNKNFNSYYSKLKESFFKYCNNWEDYLHLNEVYLENKLINTINSDFLYDSGENFTSNIFYDNDKLYVKKMNEGLNIIKIKRIQNIPKREYPVSFIHKKEYMEIFTDN